MPKESTLERLHDVLMENLIEMIQSGTATPADKKVALELLKNSGYSENPTHPEARSPALAALPFSSDEEVDAA